MPLFCLLRVWLFAMGRVLTSLDYGTLFVMVWQRLAVSSWNKEEGPPRSGDEVTVKDEKAGEARSAGSFWARVTAGPERAAGSAVDTYGAVDAAGGVADSGAAPAAAANFRISGARGRHGRQEIRQVASPPHFFKM